MENTSDSFMPRPLLFCLKSGRSVCYSVPDNNLMPKSVFQKMGFQKKEFISLCHSMIQLDFTQDLRKIHCPVLVLGGEEDKVNWQASVRLAEEIESAEVVLISNAGHEVNKENPKELGKILTEFYKKIGS